MKVALVYDWIDSWGGAERILLAFQKLFPQAPLYTSVYKKNRASWAKDFHINSSFLNRIPLPRRILTPLMPLAFEGFNFDNYDLVISISSFAAKGIICKPATKHIHYLLTPPRFLSDNNYYLKSWRTFLRPVLNYLARWDKIAAWRPDKIISISQTVKKRCQKRYQRNSKVIYPPVDLKKWRPAKTKRENFYLVVSRLVNYKKVDLIINTFNQLGWPLKIVGRGQQENKLKKMANKNIEFLGHLTDKKLLSYYQKGQGVIFAAREDFGLVPIEAQACGTPVIAFNQGGATETIISGQTGEFFAKQTPQSLQEAVLKFSQKSYNREKCVRQAQKFSQEKFMAAWQKIIEQYE